MPYRYAIQKQDYSDYASGKVLYNLPGRPAFPIRLAQETFERCLEMRKARGLTGPVRLYDPCCGGAYHLVLLALFYGHDITEIIASDVDARALEVDTRNLALLTLEGLDQRILEIEQMKARYGKASHAEALESAAALRQQLVDRLAGEHPIRTDLFQADVFDAGAVRDGIGERPVDLVITDVPYGQKSTWQTSAGPQEDPIRAMLETLSGVLAEQAVVAVASAKRKKVSHPGYVQVGRLKLGLRLVTFLRRDSVN